MIRDPLGLLLDAYERHGPVFSLRVLHANNVFVLGPEANHFVLVSGADHFRWRDGAFADLIPLLGRRAADDRRRLPPALAADHAARLPPRADRGLPRRDGGGGAARARSGGARGRRSTSTAGRASVALRVAMRALFGLDPDDKPADLDPAHEFERALAYYGEDYWLQVLRGPRTPFARLQRARERLDALIYAEIARRRRSGARGADVLSLLLDAQDEDGEALTDRADPRPGDDAAVRGPRHDDLDDLLPAVGARGAAGLGRELEPAIDETLRLYPAAWIGPRRSVKPFALHGVHVPAGVPVELLELGEPPAARRVGRAATPSGPSASSPARRRRSRAAPTCRSAAARGSASACASASSRST